MGPSCDFYSGTAHICGGSHFECGRGVFGFDYFAEGTVEDFRFLGCLVVRL